MVHTNERYSIVLLIQELREKNLYLFNMLYATQMKEKCSEILTATKSFAF